MIRKETVLIQLTKVMDPELGISIVDLGLIYEVKVVQNEIKVIMTLTTPGCPLAPVIEDTIRKALAKLGAKKIEVELVWEPVWTVDRMSEEGKLKLGMR